MYSINIYNLIEIDDIEKLIRIITYSCVANFFPFTNKIVIHTAQFFSIKYYVFFFSTIILCY